MTTSEVIRLGLSWLGTYGLHSTLLLGAAWAWCRWCPPRSLRERERLWRWALLGGLLTTSVQVGLDRRTFAWSFEWPQITAVALEADRPQAPATEPPAALPVPAPSVVQRSAPDSLARTIGEPHGPRTSRPPAPRSTTAARRPTPAPVREVAPLASTSPFDTAPAVPQASASPISWPRLVVTGWGSLAALGGLGMLLSWGRLRRRMAGRVPISGGPLFERFEALRRRAGIEGPVRLSTTDALCSPFTVGLVRLEVCIPRAVVTELSSAQQDAILAHELAHVRRRDPAWACLLAWLDRLLFFQPLHRLARRELAELAELACDEQAVLWTGGRLTLAGTLTEVATWVLDGRPQPAGLPGLVGHRSRLARRVARLLEPDARREPEVRRWWTVPAGVLALTGFALAAPGIASTGVREPGERADERIASAEPAGLPAALPTSNARPTAPAPASPVPATDDLLADEQRRLAEELELLRSSLAELAGELEGTPLDAAFAPELARLTARLTQLDAQHARIRDLLQRLREVAPPRSPNHPTSEPTTTR